MAANGRLVLQLGELGDISRLLSFHGLLQSSGETYQNGPAASNGQEPPAAMEQ
jgi:hypothetical protein